eukprot:NODE_14_length_42432_cov_0.433799.p2 type:complete len:1014 gc:universal NODE_14_length_42432_cov_0.433799:1785-4826(+)
MFTAFNAEPTNVVISQDINNKFCKAVKSKNVELLEELLLDNLDNTDLCFSIYKLLAELTSDKIAISYGLKALEIKELPSIYANMMIKAIEFNYPSIAKYCLSRLAIDNSTYLGIINNMHSKSAHISSSSSPISVEIIMDSSISKSFKKLYDLLKHNPLSLSVSIEFKPSDFSTKPLVTVDNSNKSTRTSSRLKQSQPVPNSPILDKLTLIYPPVINENDLHEHLACLISNYKQYHSRKLNLKSDFYNWCILFDTDPNAVLRNEDQLLISSATTLDQVFTIFIKIAMNNNYYAHLLGLYPYIDNPRDPHLLLFIVKSIYNVHVFIQHERISTVHPSFTSIYYSTCDIIYNLVQSDPHNSVLVECYSNTIYNHFTNSINSNYLLDYPTTIRIPLVINPINQNEIRHLNEIKGLDARPSLVDYCRSLLKLTEGYYFNLQFSHVMYYLFHFDKSTAWLNHYMIFILFNYPDIISDFKLNNCFKMFILQLVRHDISLLMLLHEYLESINYCELLDHVYIGINGLLQLPFETSEKQLLLTCYYQMNLFNINHSFKRQLYKTTNVEPFLVFLRGIKIDLNQPCSIKLQTDVHTMFSKLIKNTREIGILNCLEYYNKLSFIFSKSIGITSIVPQNLSIECKVMNPIITGILQVMPHDQIKHCYNTCLIVEILEILSESPNTLLKRINKVLDLKQKLVGNKYLNSNVHDCLLLLQLAPFKHLNIPKQTPILIDHMIQYAPYEAKLKFHSSKNPVIRFVQASTMMKMEYKPEYLKYLFTLQVPLEYQIKRIYYYGKFAASSSDFDMIELMNDLTIDNIYKTCIIMIDRLLETDLDNWQYRGLYYKSKLMVMNKDYAGAFQTMSIFKRNKGVLVTHISMDEIVGKYYYYNYTLNDYYNYLMYKNDETNNELNTDAIINTSRLVYIMVARINKLQSGNKRAILEIVKLQENGLKQNDLQAYHGSIIKDDRLWYYLKYSRDLLEDMELVASCKTLEFMILVVNKLLKIVTRDEMIMICKGHFKQFL